MAWIDQLVGRLRPLASAVSACSSCLFAVRDRVTHELNEQMMVAGTQAELLGERRVGEPQQRSMKHEAFAVRTRESEPPKGPGLVKAPGPAERDSVPLQSGRRVRADAGNGTRGVILLVDDEELLLRTTRRMLEQRGFRVVTAGDGAAAIELALRTPDLGVLLTDLSLPGMDGHELARRLRWALPELRVLFMSGFDAETSGLGAGPSKEAFLSKPFTARELEDRVSELFGSTDSDATAQRG